ncbi:MAG: DNA-deoxyinosine glycosylase [Bacteroidetes bacterium]|nr:DNA-deoxyinosine glycosylase [Bacteroidota bacterium]
MNDSIEHPTLYSFPPILPEKPRILLLGTMPGGESLKLQQYYAFNRNHFWPLIYRLLGEQQDPWEQSYEKRVKFLKNHHIALWDVYAACIRKKGSLDQSIEQGVPNAILPLLKAYPTITTLFFNGSTSAKGFKTYSDNLLNSDPQYKDVLNRISCIKLPSSSPIPTKNCRNIFEKYHYWLPVAEAPGIIDAAPGEDPE